MFKFSKALFLLPVFYPTPPRSTEWREFFISVLSTSLWRHGYLFSICWHFRFMSFPIIIWQIIIKTTISPGMDAWVGEGLLQALLQHIVPWLIQFPINGAGSPLLLWGKRGFAVIVMVLGICISKCGRDYYESVFFSVSLLVIIVFCRPTAYLLANQRTTPHSQSLHALPLPHPKVLVAMARRDIPRAISWHRSRGKRNAGQPATGTVCYESCGAEQSGRSVAVVADH